MQDILKGKLTYLSGLGLIIAGVAELYAGEYELGCTRILEGLTALGLRRALDNPSSW